MDTAVPGAQARTSLHLPSSRQVPGASLPATFWKASQRSFLPLPWAMPASQEIPLLQEEEGCLSF